MNKKRYLIIIILIIFLFLSIFTFANPFTDGDVENAESEVEETGKDKEKQPEEEIEEEKETEEVVEQVITIDNSYDLALEALKKAEASLTKKDYETALDLVNKVKDDNQSKELQERLEEVLNSINTKELVEKLVKMTKSSTDKKELDSAREFNEANEILGKVEELENKDLKESLEKELDEIIHLLEDTAAPKVNIEDGAILNSYTKIEVEDETEVTLELNGTEIENNYEAKDGVYELVVIDEAFNEVKIKFTIDIIAPTATIDYSKSELTNEDVIVTLNPSEDVKVTNNDGKLVYTFEENGEFTFEFEDIAGNKGTTKAVVDYIDKKLPEATVTYSTENLTNENVTVTITLSEEVKEVTGWELSADKKVLTKEFAANETDSIEVKDLAGNKITVNYSVTNIDKELPEAIVTYSTENFINGNVTVTITLSEEVKEVTGWKLSVDKKVLTKEFTANETDSIEVKDLAGNKITVNYSVTNIDKNSPTIKDENGNSMENQYDENGDLIEIYYKEVTPIVEDESIESIKIYTQSMEEYKVDFVSGTTIRLNGTFIIVATDKAGNTTEATFTVDNIAPKILLLDRLTVIRGNLIPIKPVIIDANLDEVIITLDGEDIHYKDGDQLTLPGKYEITAIDKAGNTSKTSFTMDNSGPEIYAEVDTNLLPEGIDIPGVDDVVSIKLNIDSIEGLVSNLIAFQEVKLKVKEDNFDPKSIIVLRKSNTSINLPFDYTLPTYNKIDYTYGDTITLEGEYIVLAADKALNISFGKFIIDRTAPKVNNIIPNEYNGEVTIDVEDANLSSIKLQKKVLGGYEIIPSYLSNGEVIKESGEYKLTATDKANNKTVVEFKIDSEDPTITGVTDKYIYNKSVSPVISDDNLDSVVVTHKGNVIESKATYTEDGIYTITATDAAKNSVTVGFEIDKDAIKIENAEDSTTSVTPKIISRGKITSIELYRNESLVVGYTNENKEAGEHTLPTIDEAGNYVLTLVDEYENSVTTEFAIDLANPVIEVSEDTIYVPAKDGETLELLDNDTLALLNVNVKDDTKVKKLEVVSINNEVNFDKNNPEISIDPSDIGIYTVEYKVTDKFDKTNSATVKINVFLSNFEIILSFDESQELKTTYNGMDQKGNIKACIHDKNNITQDICEYYNNEDTSKIDFKITNVNGVVTEFKNAGTYRITATVKNQPDGHQLTLTKDFIIEKAEVEVKYTLDSSQTTVYDGTPKTYVASIDIYDEDGIVVTKPIYTYQTPNGDAGNYNINVGAQYYNDYVSNYNIKGTTTTVTIEQAELIAYIKDVQGDKIIPGFRYANEGLAGTEFEVTIHESEIKIEVKNVDLIGWQIVIIDVDTTSSNYNLSPSSIDFSQYPDFSKIAQGLINTGIKTLKTLTGIDGQVLLRKI